MHACIRIKVNGGTTTVPLTHEVCRLGNGPSCEIRIDVQSEHALTVFRRNNEFHLLNRSFSTLRVGKHKLKRGHTCKWSYDARVQVEAIQLQLTTMQDDAHTVRNNDNVSREAQPHPKSDSAKQPKSASKQICVIVGCLVMMGILLAGTSASTDTGSNAASLDSAIQEVNRWSSGKGDSDWSIELLKQLTQLRIDIELGDLNRARTTLDEAKMICNSVAASTSENESIRSRVSYIANSLYVPGHLTIGFGG